MKIAATPEAGRRSQRKGMKRQRENSRFEIEMLRERIEEIEGKKRRVHARPGGKREKNFA